MAPSTGWIAEALDEAMAKVDRLLDRQPGLFLHATKDGSYSTCEPQWWTSGFWGGLLWLAFAQTKDDRYAKAALPITRGVADCFTDDRFYRLHHDVGFQFLHTAVAQHRLVGDPEARRIGLLAACFEMSRFILDARFLRAWNVEGSEDNSIIDSCMNLPLLTWAAGQTADDRFTQIAVAHADTVVNRLMRLDGSVPHIAHFDRVSGTYGEWEGGSQAFGIGSVWARGQAWAIHGLSQLAKETHLDRFAKAASHVADNYLERLDEGSSQVPVWDFDAPADQARDSSAASCAASGLLELAANPSLDRARSQHYRQRALGMIETLYCDYSQDGGEALLSGGTEHYPAGRNINTGLIYGDFYYLEALVKAAGLSKATRV